MRFHFFAVVKLLPVLALSILSTTHVASATTLPVPIAHPDTIQQVYPLPDLQARVSMVRPTATQNTPGRVVRVTALNAGVAISAANRVSIRMCSTTFHCGGRVLEL